jgi:hypothetical protein
VAKFKDESLETSFSIPDAVTVAKQLAHSARTLELRNEHLFWRQFLAALILVEDWESAVIPDLSLVFKTRIADDEAEDAVYLDEATDPRITSLIMWVGGEAVRHIINLETIPKN